MRYLLLMIRPQYDAAIASFIAHQQTYGFAPMAVIDKIDGQLMGTFDCGVFSALHARYRNSLALFGSTSWRLMERRGMQQEGTFANPLLVSSHPPSEHILYEITRPKSA